MTSHGLKLSLTAALLAGVAMTTTAAYAEEATSVLDGVSAYVAVTSDYRYRGISQNSKEITPQASINWSGDYGWYAGTWLSKTNWGGGTPSLETDFYIGKHTDLYGTDLNVEAYYYAYPDYKRGGGSRASYFETIAQLSHTFDKLTFTVTGSWSPEWSLGGDSGYYAAGTASYAVNDWLSISSTVGHQWVDATSYDYTHWDVGATATWQNFALDVRYVDNSITDYECSAFWMGTHKACKGTVVAMVTYNIAKLF